MLDQRLSSSTDLSALAQLLLSNEMLARGRFQGNEAIPTDAIVKDVLQDVERKLATGQGRVYSESGLNGRMSGSAFVENSAWDSKHFETSIGRLSLVVFDPKTDPSGRRELLSKVLDLEQFRMLSARVNLLDIATIQALEREGAVLTDVLLTFRFNSSWSMPGPSTDMVHTAEARPEDHATLVKKAGKLFTIDRFHSDPNLPGARSDQLYSEWVANSFRGLADIVIVARSGDEPVGFITCKVGRVAQDFKYGVIDLVGVEPTLAGRGVGSALVRSALEWFAPRVPSVYVGTQAANNRAVKLYERAGFRHACSEASLHLWPS